MTLSRATILLRRYGLAVLAAAVVGIGLGYVGATAWNSTVKPRWQATAAVVIPNDFDEKEPPTAAELEANVLSAKEIAGVANQEELRRGDASIVVNSSDGTMSFMAEGRSNEEAKVRAADMRQRYLDALNESEAPDARLAANFSEAKAIQAQILRLQDAATPKVNGPEEFMTNLEVEIGSIQAEIDALEKESVTLSVQQLLSDDEEEAATLGSQVTQLRNQAAALRAELASRIETFEFLGGVLETPQTPDAAGSQSGTDSVPTKPITEDDWLLNALIARYASLQEQYAAGVLGAIGPNDLPPVTAANITPPKVSPSISAVVGGIALLLTAAGILLLRDVTRKPLWSVHDIESLTALMIPHRHAGHRRLLPFNGRRAEERRRMGLLQLNRITSAAIQNGSNVVAISPIDSRNRAVSDLAVDLAHGLARAEWRVAILDAASSSAIDPAGKKASVRSLSDLIAAARGNRPSLAKLLISNSPRLEEEVTYIISGDLAPEMLASAVTGEAISLLRKYFDMVVILTDNIGNPVADSLIGRSDAVVAVAALGRTPRARMEDVGVQMERERVRILAVVLATWPARLGLARLRNAMTNRKNSKAVPVAHPGQGDEDIVPEPATNDLRASETVDLTVDG